MSRRNSPIRGRRFKSRFAGGAARRWWSPSRFTGRQRTDAGSRPLVPHAKVAKDAKVERELNAKSEDRNPKSDRNPNPENRKLAFHKGPLEPLSAQRCRPISAFGFRPSFGLREFGFRNSIRVEARASSGVG